ncbi:MAG: hypothetical protein R2847_09280 [Bacteroidia bacterium]
MKEGYEVVYAKKKKSEQGRTSWKKIYSKNIYCLLAKITSVEIPG